MAGLNHDFLLLSSREHVYTDFMKWINSPLAVQIHNDVMEYIQDTLNWVTCYTPSKNMMKRKGLNFYGPTIIKSDGAIVAGKIFTAWAELLSNGPMEIKLTGAYSWIEGESKGTSHYSAIKADRDEIIEGFKKLAGFSKQVIDSNDELFILHLGI